MSNVPIEPIMAALMNLEIKSTAWGLYTITIGFEIKFLKLLNLFYKL